MQKRIVRSGAPPGIEISLATSWGSDQDQHRIHLRQGISRRFGSDPTLLDLNQLPRTATHAISISHCKGLGGFLLAPRPYVVGLDLELSARVGVSQVGRVAFDPAEVKEAPSASAFWAAKEAAFKSLYGHSQPRGLKDLRIGHWSETEPGLFRCVVLKVDGRENIGISGLIFEDGIFTYAVFWGHDFGADLASGSSFYELNDE